MTRLQTERIMVRKQCADLLIYSQMTQNAFSVCRAAEGDNAVALLTDGTEGLTLLADGNADKPCNEMSSGQSAGEVTCGFQHRRKAVDTMPVMDEFREESWVTKDTIMAITATAAMVCHL